MQVRSNNSIKSVGKEFWRFVEVYIFVVISSISGSAITKDFVSAKSKAKDKTLRTSIELLIAHSSAPPDIQNQPAKNESIQNERLELARARATASSSAIEKGNGIAKSSEMTRVATTRQYLRQESTRHSIPLNLLQEISPLLI
jgi:hypothetical protein